jgi:hypothetical protein
MGYERHGKEATRAVEIDGRAAAPAQIAIELPADFFDTASAVAADAGRKVNVLRQARQLRDAWRRDAILACAAPSAQGTQAQASKRPFFRRSAARFAPLDRTRSRGSDLLGPGIRRPDSGLTLALCKAG